MPPTPQPCCRVSLEFPHHPLDEGKLGGLEKDRHVHHHHRPPAMASARDAGRRWGRGGGRRGMRMSRLTCPPSRRPARSSPATSFCEKREKWPARRSSCCRVSGLRWGSATCGASRTCATSTAGALSCCPTSSPGRHRDAALLSRAQPRAVSAAGRCWRFQKHLARLCGIACPCSRALSVGLYYNTIISCASCTWLAMSPDGMPWGPSTARRRSSLA